MKILINCAFILFAASGTCAAQITGNANTDISPELFVNQAAISGMKEIETSKIAQDKAQNEKIKSFAMMMVTDHSNVHAELKALAKSKDIKLPKPDLRNMEPGSNVINQNTGNNQTGNNQTTGRDTTTVGVGNVNKGSMGTDSLKLLTEQDIAVAVQKLSGLKGVAFDTEYASMMIDDHKNSIILFERASRSTDSNVRFFAIKHLPTLRSHLTQITTLHTTIGQP